MYSVPMTMNCSVETLKKYTGIVKDTATISGLSGVCFGASGFGLCTASSPLMPDGIEPPALDCGVLAGLIGSVVAAGCGASRYASSELHDHGDRSIYAAATVCGGAIAAAAGATTGIVAKYAIDHGIKSETIIIGAALSALVGAGIAHIRVRSGLPQNEEANFSQNQRNTSVLPPVREIHLSPSSATLSLELSSTHSSTESSNISV